MDNNKKIVITDHQFKTITTLYICGPSTVVISSIASAIAKQDAWLSAAISIVFGLIFIFLYMYLGGLYPDKDLVVLTTFLLGKWLGGFIALNYIFLWFVAEAHNVWFIGDFITTQYMPETPVYAINLLFLTVVSISLLYGLETIGRVSEIFFIIVVLLFTASMLLVTPNIKPDNLFPIFEKGIGPALKGTLPLLSFTAIPYFTLNMVYPASITDVKKAKKAMIIGYFTAMIIIFVSVLMCTLVLGSTITADSRFPVYILNKEINVGVIFSRVESLIVIVWIITMFFTNIFVFYACVTGISSLFGLKDYKVLIIPLALIIAALSGNIFKSVPYQMNWNANVWLPYSFTFGFIIPCILLVATVIKKAINKS